MHQERNCVDQQILTEPNVTLLQSTLIIFHVTLYVEEQLAMDIIKMVHSTTVLLLDTKPLMMPTSVDCPSPTGSKDSVSTSGAMLQDIMRLVPAHITVHEQLPQVSLALTQH